MAVLQGYFPPLIEALNVKKPLLLQIHFKFRNPNLSLVQKPKSIFGNGGISFPFSCCRCQSETATFYTSTSEDEYYEDDDDGDHDEDDLEATPQGTTSSGRRRGQSPPPLLKRRKRYRKAYPGEKKGITEEMRFVAMKLRNTKSVSSLSDDESLNSDSAEERDSEVEDEDDNGSKANDSASESVSNTWQPSMEGFTKHLADCKLVFETLERIVEQSDDVAYAYFRKTGLERSEGLARDIEWLRERDVEIPEPSTPGVSYAKYLEELSTTNAPSFLTHFYNVHFSHVAGGQVIVKQVSDKLLDGRELEFCRWDGDAQQLLKEVRDKINRLGEHWSRSDKNKCLSEASKAFKYMGQIVRLIIL